jgi:hypothetical protein
MQTPILGGSNRLRSVNAADNTMINLIPEIIPSGGKQAAYLFRAPGLRLLATVGSGPIRGLWNYQGTGYVVSGSELYSIDSSWNATFLGNVSGTGPVSMADNGTQLFIACDPEGFIYNRVSGLFQQITDPDFPGAQCVGYLDGFFVFTQPNSQQFWITAILEGTQIDPLDFASAEGYPDNIVSMLIDHREIWLFGTNSTEVWYDAGAQDFPFQRIQGAFNEVGCLSPFGVCKADNRIFWIGQDARGFGMIYAAQGYIAQRVSTHAVEWQIQQYPNLQNTIAYSYQQGGHTYVAFIFPDADTSWFYDVATGEWCQRAGFNPDLGEFTRHRSNCQMNFSSEIVVGDFENGNLYAFDLDKYDDNGTPQKWLRRWSALPQGANNLNRTTHHSLQLDCKSGVGTLDTTDPQVMLRWSDDSGHTFSNEHWASMGPLGDYSRRVYWRRLGMTTKLRQRIYEVSGTDPVEVVILGAELLLSSTVT